MRYAVVCNGNIQNILPDKPVVWHTSDGPINFTDQTTDEELLPYGIYPYEENYVEFVQDKYHLNVFNYDIQDAKVVGTRTVEQVPLDLAKHTKKTDITQEWTRRIKSGSFMSSALNTRVDARRNDIDNDAQNLAEIINAGEANPGMFPILWKCTDTTKEVTLDDLKALRLEMAQYAMNLYSDKFTTYAAIDAATTLEEVMGIELE
ncbi:DUF4376 domain-containing protein [Geobacter sp. SVR]|uniref:DUF4376 domain-containing protein n=1 Tax=Geobacter sp. SVR TaxID=2495594 RepID=UPI00143EF8C1|nr:DUF4376 domain-containing protein [Geobacter sp. SVR]BCS54064.1 hypothetical protein GSVR_23720 [Geobacter sp. SVR]GCF87547.1 hypothetical protein GSbR_41470 [Geobacter sp. SVR]